MPKMIYGTAWKDEDTTRLVELALTNGFRGLDVACQPKHYREDLVGLGIQNAIKNTDLKREDIFIQTKFTPIAGQDLNDMPYYESDDIQTQLEKSFLTSKKNLQVDFIDSYLIHSPFTPLEDLVGVYETMEEFVQCGQVGQLGLSNCYDVGLLIYLFDVAKVKPKVLQNRFYKDSDYDKEIREFCKFADITYQSFWSLTANSHILKSQEMQQLIRKYKKTIPQVFYKFLNQIGITPLNGTTSKLHMIQDLDIDSFNLEDYEVQALQNLL